mmetsp:Transcript_22439/g.41204  ORF Transcript_22439/g.41204 Transcript_22439/m.41204 type:complete len:98 (-) Transcript_22439:129-422(-)
MGDGTSEISDSPDNDIVINAKSSGMHRADTAAFTPPLRSNDVGNASNDEMEQWPAAAAITFNRIHGVVTALNTKCAREKYLARDDGDETAVSLGGDF